MVSCQSIDSYKTFPKEILEKALILKIKQTNFTVNDIVEIFNLNYKQSIFLKLFFDKNLEQKIIYLLGDEGVGKTRVINAIEFYF